MFFGRRLQDRLPHLPGTNDLDAKAGMTTKTTYETVGKPTWYSPTASLHLSKSFGSKPYHQILG